MVVMWRSSVSGIDRPTFRQGHGFDLEHQLGVGQRPDFADRVGRVRRGKHLLAKIDHFGEVGHVGHEDRDLDHLFEAGPRSLQHPLEIAERVAGLSTEIATMRMMVGLTRPDSGEVRYAGTRYTDLMTPARVVGSVLDARCMEWRRGSPGRTWARSP